MRQRLRKQLERRRRRRHASALWSGLLDFPDDADGKALRQVAERSDLGRPLDVDFVIRVPDEAAAEALATAVAAHGYLADARPDDDDESRWCCYCTRQSILLTYEWLQAAQAELLALSAAFGGRARRMGHLRERSDMRGARSDSPRPTACGRQLARAPHVSALGCRGGGGAEAERAESESESGGGGGGC